MVRLDQWFISGLNCPFSDERKRGLYFRVTCFRSYLRLSITFVANFQKLISLSHSVSILPYSVVSSVVISTKRLNKRERSWPTWQRMALHQVNQRMVLNYKSDVLEMSDNVNSFLDHHIILLLSDSEIYSWIWMLLVSFTSSAVNYYIIFSHVYCTYSNNLLYFSV